MNAGPSQDFFADLERELVEATNQRRPRLRRARTRRLATMSTILVAIVAAGGGLAVAVTSSDDAGDGTPASSAPVVTHTPAPAGPAHAPKPGSYTVSVLNGTTVPGLARGVANRLTSDKQKIGNVTNATTQDRSSTIVEYAPGHRAEADAVALAIDVAPDAIRPESAGSRTIAGDQATVVVIVGADQNTTPQHHK